MSLKSFFLAAPPSDLSVELRVLVQEWNDEPTSKQILNVINMSAQYVISEFALSALEAYYTMAVERENEPQPKELILTDDQIDRAIDAYFAQPGAGTDECNRGINYLFN
jgi:hypothetical protein